MTAPGRKRRDYADKDNDDRDDENAPSTTPAVRTRPTVRTSLAEACSPSLTDVRRGDEEKMMMQIMLRAGKPAEERDKRAELQAEDGDSQSTRGSAFAVGGAACPRSGSGVVARIQPMSQTMAEASSMAT